MPALRVLVALALLGTPVLASAQGVGVTPDGRKGHVHRVVRGDTLWDITAKYLETPWIWPSIWKENEGIENPHLIFPGDLIWITEGEMRKLSPEEAEALLRGEGLEEGAPGAAETPAAAAPAPGPAPLSEDPFAVLDAGETQLRRQLLWEGLAFAPFISVEEYAAAGAVLGNPDEHYWISQEQVMSVSLGEGAVHPGEDFAVFRVRSRVSHPETGELLGYFIEIVGKAQVVEVHPETSMAKVLQAKAEIEPGDRLAPFEDAAATFTAVAPEGEISGTIVAMQPHRIYSGDLDLVVLDRGSADGLLSGNELVVYRAGKLVTDPLTTARLLQPDDVVGRLFVLKTSPKTSVAVVTRTRTELAAGDLFRTP
jgi:hypothetical protein